MNRSEQLIRNIDDKSFDVVAFEGHLLVTAGALA